MQSSHTIAAGHKARRPGAYRFGSKATGPNPFKVNKPKSQPKPKIEQPKVTPGEWYSTGTAIAVDEETTIAVAHFGPNTDLATRRQDMRLMAKAPKLFDIVSRLAAAKPGDFETLVAKAKEVMGGAHG